MHLYTYTKLHISVRGLLQATVSMFTAVFLVIFPYCLCLARNYSVSFIIDTSGSSFFQQFLLKSANNFVEGLNATRVPPSIFYVSTPIETFNGVCHNSYNSSTLITKQQQQQSRSHKRAWGEYCIKRSHVDPEDVLLVLNSGSICTAANCVNVLDFHVQEQTSELFYHGWHHNPGDLIYAYSIKCSFVIRVWDTFEPCNITLSKALSTASVDYISVVEFTRNETALVEVLSDKFERLGFEAESGIIWKVKENRPRVNGSCPGQLTVSNLTGTCLPRELCGDTNLHEIPNFDGRFPNSLICDGNETGIKVLYDKMKSRRCLQNKRMCMFGDSTLEETIHDIVVLLSGAGVNITDILSYYYRMKYQYEPLNMTFGDLEIEMYAQGRLKKEK